MPTIHIPSPGSKEGHEINIEDIDKVEPMSVSSGSVIHLKNGSPLQTGLTPEQVTGMIKDANG